MKIDLNEFWKFVKEWTVGRLIALLILIAWIICCSKSLPCLNGKLLFSILLLSILLETFELSHNKLGKIKQKQWVYVVSMMISLLSIIGFSIFFLVFFYSSI